MPQMIGLAQDVEGADYVRVLKWLKSEGSFVSAGDVLVLVCEGSSDLVEIKSEQDCTLAKILIAEGPERLLGREILGILSFTDDSEKAITSCIGMGDYINNLLDGLDFAEDEDEQENGDEDPNTEYTSEFEGDNHPQDIPVRDHYSNRPQSNRQRGFLAGLFGAAARSVAPGMVSSNARSSNSVPNKTFNTQPSQPKQIGNVIQRGGFVIIQDDRGVEIGAIGFRAGDELRGFTSTTVSVKQGGFINIYNSKGSRVGGTRAS